MQNPRKDIEYQREKDTAVMDAFEAYDWEMTYKAARERRFYQRNVLPLL